jgi:hypothetical protein
MNITKSQLKKLIKEELQNVLSEGESPPASRDFMSWLPDFIQDSWGTPEPEPIYHGIEWYDRQPEATRGKIFDRYRSQGGYKDIGADGPNKEKWNDWLWKWEVPSNFKRGNY